MRSVHIELIAREPKGTPRPTPLLFIHGVFTSAHIWEPFFLPFFAKHGFRAIALSLRGHGASGGRDRLATTRLRDYVNDVERIAGGLESKPVLIGHSLGGLVVQHYLNRRPVPAAVLLASGPPHGMAARAIEMALANPVLFRDMTLLQNLGPGAATLEGTRRALFRDDTPDDYIRKVLPDAQPESHMAVLDAMGLDLPSSRRRTDIPVLVLGAGKDPFISRTAVEMTALTYGSRAEIYPDMPHAMMLDQDWEQVATRMLEWLEATLAGGPAAKPPKG
jgi:pimeloyl-ACP methyl ester carboxylesterase